MAKEMQGKTVEIDLSKVNPRIAGRILGKRTAFVPPVAGRALAPTPKHERIEKQLTDYKDAVNSTLRALLKEASLNSVLTVLTLVILLAAVVWSNLNGILAALGITGTNAFAQAKAWQNTIIAYFKDASKLRTSVSYLQAQYDGCDPNDVKCLDKVASAIDTRFQQLENASKS